METRFLQSRQELLKNQIGLIAVRWQTVSEDIDRACGQMEMGRNRKSGRTVTLHSVLLSWFSMGTRKGEEGASSSLTSVGWLAIF